MLYETILRPKLQSAVLKWFTSENVSFEQETAQQGCAAAFMQSALGGLLDIGTVMGKITVGGGTPAAAVANGGNAGNGTIGTVTALAGAQVGAYTLSFTSATAFNVYDPKGNLVGSGTVGTAFANQLGFTVTAGSTAFAAGDSFTVAVPPGSYAANAGNTGNGTCGAVTAKAGCQAGTYSGQFITATKFNLYDPFGKFVGGGATGTAFANQLGFTITAGSTAFAAGDGFSIAVQSGPGLVVPLNFSAVDGSQVAMGVVVRPQTISPTANAPVVLAERLTELLSDGLIWPAGSTATQQAAAIAQLAGAYNIVRNS